MHRQALYSEMAGYYDKIYWWKDYETEVRFLTDVYRNYGMKGKRILEVACGTGNHTRILARLGYDVTGVDLSDDVLRVAKKKVGTKARLLRGDMRNLPAEVGDGYDSVVCLFSAISYNTNAGDLKATLHGFFKRLKPGGVLVFDTHFTKAGFWDGHRGEDIFDDGKTIGARVGYSTRKGDVGQISFTYLIKDGRKVIVLRNDVHKLGLYDPDDFIAAMKEVGFSRTELFGDWVANKPFRAHAGKAHVEKEHVFVGVK